MKQVTEQKDFFVENGKNKKKVCLKDHNAMKQVTEQLTRSIQVCRGNGKVIFSLYKEPYNFEFVKEYIAYEFG